MKREHIVFVKNFLRAYSQPISEREIENKIRLIEKNMIYLWQIPIENKAWFLEGDEAKQAFDCLNKKGALEFFFDGPFSNEYPLPLKRTNNNSLAIELNDLEEFYVFDKNYKWCYVVTHEKDECGPFFFRTA